MKRIVLSFIVVLMVLANYCFAETEIKVGRLSYSLNKNTKPIELLPAASAYPKTGGGHIVNVIFPGYDSAVAVNGSGYYPGWTGIRNETSGIITVTSPREYVYIFDNGYDANDANTAELNAECNDVRLDYITDPNGDYKSIYYYDSNGLVDYIKENNDPCSVYLLFNYDSNYILESIAAIDPSVSSSSANYSRTYSLAYDSNDRVISVTAGSGGGCGCGCSGGDDNNDWLTDIYDVNDRIIAQKDNTEQTIYTYSYHTNNTLDEKKDKDGNIIKKIEFELLPDDKSKVKIYDYVDANNYRYSEKLRDTDNTLISETVYRDLRDNRIDPNLYDSNCFVTTYIYDDEDYTVIPDGADANGTGIRTKYDYDSDYNLKHEYQYDANGTLRTIVSNSYSSSRIYRTTDIRGATTEYDYISGTGLLYKYTLDSDTYNAEHYYRYIYDSKNRRITEELKLNESGVDDGNDPAVQTKHFEYDKYGNICKEYYNNIDDRADGNSLVTEFVYNAFGNVIWQISPEGVVNGKAYDQYGRITDEFILANGIDDFNQIANPLDCTLSSLTVTRQVSYEYNSICGKIDTIYTAVDSNSFYFDSPDSWYAVKYNYDYYGRKTSEVRDYGNTDLTTSYQYNAQDEIEITTYPDGHTEQVYRDGRGLEYYIVKSGGSDSITTENVYDNRDQLIQTLLDSTVLNSYSYDDYGRQIKSYKGDFTSGQYSRYIYDDDTDDIETEEIWDSSPTLINETFRVYDIFGRVIYNRRLEDPSSGEDAEKDKITFFRYNALGNLTMTANLGIENTFYPYYDYSYSPEEYYNTGDIIELKKYNPLNAQLEAVIKFEYPEILESYFDYNTYEDVEIFDYNLADTEDYILNNDSIVNYVKYTYNNLQLANQSLYQGIDPNTDEFIFTTKSSYEYDDSGRRIKVTDADDNYITTQYNSLNLSTSETLWQGKSILRISDGNGYDPNFVPYPVRRTLTAYNGMGLRTRAAVLYDPNADTDIDNVDLMADKVTDFVYDSNGKLYQQREYFGDNFSGSYNMALTEYCYDDLGRISQIEMGNLEEVYAFGSLFYSDKRPLKYISYGYNSAGYKDTQTITDVNTIDDTTAAFSTYYSYDGQGKLEKIENAQGTLNQYFYDSLNRKYREIDSAGMVIDYYYDGLGNLISMAEDVNNSPRTTYYEYDRHNRKTAVTANSDSTLYSYNYLDNITDIEYPDGKEIAYGYNPEGNVIYRTITENSISVTTNYKRDPLGRISCKQYSNDPNWSDPNSELPFDEFLYDAAGNKSIVACIEDGNDFELGMYNYNGLGNLTSSGESYSLLSYPVNYTYDQRGLLTSVTYPDGKTVAYQRDALGRVTSVSYDGKVIATYYWLGNRVIGKTIGDFEYTAIVDSLGRIDFESYDSLSFDYGYASHTNRLTDRNTVEYGYNTLGQVTSEEATSYTCDILGNPTNAIEDNLIYTLDNEDRVKDVNDGSGIFASYAYDRLGRRISKTADSETIYFAYDKDGNIIAEYIKDGDNTLWQKDYIYGALGEVIYMQLPPTTAANDDAIELLSFLEAWLCYPDCSQDDLDWDFDDDDQINFTDWAGYCDNFVNAFKTNGRFVLTDIRNSVIGITDGNSVIEITYNAWGVPSYTGSLDGLNILWNGYYLDDETGNYYLRNRYYSPLERRFVTQDPRGINPDGNWNNGFSILNQYIDGYGLLVYGQHDPINNKDDWGLEKKICCKLSETYKSYIPPMSPGGIGGFVNKTRCYQKTMRGCEGQRAIKTCKCYYRNRPEIKVYGAEDKECCSCKISIISEPIPIIGHYAIEFDCDKKPVEYVHMYPENFGGWDPNGMHVDENIAFPWRLNSFTTSCKTAARFKSVFENSNWRYSPIKIGGDGNCSAVWPLFYSMKKRACP